MTITTTVARVIKTDVLVCGAGCAGLAAALAAARQGAHTTLVERAPFAGGIMTCVGLPFLDGIADSVSGKLVTTGVARELAATMRICPPDAQTIFDFDPTCVYWPHKTAFVRNIEALKVILDRALLAAGVHVLYHSSVCEASVKSGRIQRVLVANKDGLVAIQARQVIDATGDADVAHFAGARTELTAPTQPMTLHFRIGNVARWTAAAEQAARRECRRALDRGELPVFYGPGFSHPFAPNEAYVHAVRVPGNGADAADLTRAEIQGRADAQVMFERWKEKVPAFRKAYLITSGPYIGVRETRRIVGRYVLTANDIQAQRRFDDAIATGAWYLDLHSNRATEGSASREPPLYPGPYDIPYRALLPRRVLNLLVAGRCLSGTQRAASSFRVTATAMAVGEAAGMAAALAAKRRCTAPDLPVAILQAALRYVSAGAMAR
ncbi:MAG: FAD-dependent oxidoreductase [Lentisphaerae bacterium]|nr:FAD-dependent oxidoreductase [Lentisphaerota bacterium]